MYELEILNGPWQGKRFRVTEPELIIGRDAECHLRLPDDEASRKHASIEVQPDGIFIRDLSSLNGTWVNNQVVPQARLNDGDVIEIGRTRMRYRKKPPAPSPTRRRLSTVHMLATLAVVLFLLLQLGLLAALSLRAPFLLKWLGRPPPPSPTPPPEPPAQPAPVAQETPPALTESPPPEPPPQPVETRQEPEWKEELASLRTEVEQLREQLTPPQPPPAPPEPPVDPLIVRAREMLDAAAREIQKSNFREADDILAKIQIMAPQFVPAYVERARLFEQRGMLEKAGEQWAEVLRLSVGTPLYEQAAAERIRLARLAAERKVEPDRTTTPRVPGPPGRRVRLVSADQEKLPPSEGYDEMRLVRIVLRPMASERLLDPQDVAVFVTFFDRDLDSGEIVPTRFSATSRPLYLPDDAVSGQPWRVTATYLVPLGAREKEAARTGKRWRYFGFAVRVYYRQELQDELAKPAALLEKARALPSPFHKPAEATKPAQTAR